MDPGNFDGMKKYAQLKSMSAFNGSDLLSHETFRHMIFAAFLIIAVIITGLLGYRFIEKMSLLDSLYMTVITIATVGFHEVTVLSDAGRIFTMMMIFLGIGIGGYAIGNIVAFFVQGHLLDLLRGRQMVKAITGLTDHIIVCGFGKIGREVCLILANANRDFIVIDSDEDKIDTALGMGYIAAVGDSTDDDILIKSGIKTASGLISAISDDAANVYLVLSARSLNPHIRIIARGVSEASRKKMLLAGADKVVSPFEIGGRRMATLMISPEVVDFTDSFSQFADYGLKLQKMIIKGSSSLVGKRLDESYIKRDTDGALIVGIEKRDKSMEINPPGYVVLEEGDFLLSLGNEKQIKLLNGLLK